MEEQNQNKPQTEEKSNKCCPDRGFCYCRAIAAALIIVLVWFWTPSWANIAISVLAALILIGACGCCCRKKGLVK